MIDTAQAFGVDIGGSGIKAAPVNLEKGEFAEPRLKILTPEHSTPKAVGDIVRQQLEHFEVPEDVPVGIAFPAPIKPGKKLDFMANLDQSWIGVDVTEVFSEACGRPVTVVNDADAAGLAEQAFGAAAGQDGLVIATTLGTGIGTALIYDACSSPTPSSATSNCRRARAMRRSMRHPRSVRNSTWATGSGPSASPSTTVSWSCTSAPSCSWSAVV